jgi:hypothetical protein
VQILLAVSGLAAAVMAIYFIVGVDLEGRIVTAQALQPEVDGYNRILGIVGGVGLALQIACGVVFIRWMWQSLNNATALGAGYGIEAPRAAVVAWLIPGYCLFRPFQNLADLHKRLLAPLVSRSGRWLLGSWWVCWLLGGVAADIAFVSYWAANDTDAARLPWIAVQALAAGFTLADAILAIFVVRHIQRLSEARAIAGSGDPNKAIELVAGSQRKRLVGAPFALAAVAILAVVVPTGFVYARAIAPPTWAQFRPADGSFAVLLPRPPVETPIPRSVQSNLTISGDSFKAAVNQDLAFLITYHDYPTGIISEIDPATMYDNMDLALPYSLMLDSARETTISGKPAHELHAHNADMTVVAMYVIDVDRIFVIEADFRPEVANSPDIRRFLDSFELK